MEVCIYDDFRKNQGYTLQILKYVFVWKSFSNKYVGILDEYIDSYVWYKVGIAWKVLIIKVFQKQN